MAALLFSYVRDLVLVASVALIGAGCTRAAQSNATGPASSSSGNAGATPEYFVLWGDSNQRGLRS